MKYPLAISECIKNGSRILEDADRLAEFGRYPTARALAILAQEEFAKAYLLRLVEEGAIPWCDEVHRACKDHVCKHLISVVMLHLFTPYEDDILSRDRSVREAKGDFVLPAKVADALNIFCHEKLITWRSPNWRWADPVKYDRLAKQIGAGKVDKVKQEALYVGIGKNLNVTSTPRCSEAEATEALETAGKLQDVAQCGDVWAFTEKKHIKAGLKEMLRELSEEKL